jgi:hypothetical protein
MEMLKAFLFGSVKKIDVCCKSDLSGTHIRAGLLASLAALNLQVPIHVKHSGDVDYILVHFSAGLLSSEHADIMPIV